MFWFHPSPLNRLISSSEKRANRNGRGKSVSVNLNLIAVWLLASPAFASVVTNPSTLNVTWKQGTATPVFANVEIQSTAFFSTAIATNPVGWLGIFPAAGNGTTVAIVSITPQFLRAGTYIGLVTFTEPGSQIKNSFTLRVNLTVQEGIAVTPPPTTQTVGYIAHLADGGGWTTSFRVVNLMNAPQRISVSFWSDSGSGLTLPILGIGPTTGVSLELPANGSGLLDTSGAAFSVATGWATLEASVGNTSSFTASAVLRSLSDGGQDSEAVSPMMIPSNRGFVLPFDNSGGFATGVAIVNIGAAGTLPIIIRDGDGSILLTQNLPMGAGAHSSFSLADEFPGAAGRVGTLEIGSAVGMVLGLRFNPGGSFTAILPAAKP
jgi:hypothetical protein